MEVQEWLARSARDIRENGVEGLKRSARPLYYKLLEGGNLLRAEGTPVYHHDWDVLVVLDACRLDMMQAVENEYEFLSNIEAYRSVNSVTRRWMEDNFGTAEAQPINERTAYLSGNPWSEEYLSEAGFGKLDHIWQRAWADPGTVPPEPVTDETIRTHRSGEYDRVIAHYMQPHCPFLSDPSVGPGKDIDHWGNQPQGDVWDALQRGDYPRQTILEAYLDNLRVALDDVERLLQNIDAETVVITSDHGNAFGEWGVYGHRPDLAFDSLRVVPWAETSAENVANETPERATGSHSISRKEQLESLGYL